MFIPAPIVFWLLDNLPVNQDPNLRAPAVQPEIVRADWDESVTPNLLSLQCMQFAAALRMECDLSKKPNVTLVLDRSCVELMRLYLDKSRALLARLDVDV